MHCLESVGFAKSATNVWGKHRDGLGGVLNLIVTAVEAEKAPGKA